MAQVDITPRPWRGIVMVEQVQKLVYLIGPDKEKIATFHGSNAEENCRFVSEVLQERGVRLSLKALEKPQGATP